MGTWKECFHTRKGMYVFYMGKYQFLSVSLLTISVYTTYLYVPI